MKQLKLEQLGQVNLLMMNFEQRAPEGVEGVVPYKGEVSKLIAQMVAGLKSGMSYSNARTIPEFWEKAEFIRVTSTGLKENKPHATFD